MVNSRKSRDNPIQTAVETDKPKEAEELEQLTMEVARGGGIALIGSTIVRVTTFGLHILLARVLGPAAYGLYALGGSVTAIGQSIASLGLTQGIVRYCAIYRGEDDKARLKGVLLSAAAISLVSSVLIAFILFAFARAISDHFFRKAELTNVLRVFALALPFCVLTAMEGAFAQSLRRIEYQKGLAILRSLANLGLVGLAFILGYRLAGATCGFLASGVFSAGLGLYFLWRIFPEIRSAIVPSYQIKSLLRFSLSVFFIGISYMLLGYTDRIMLGYFGKASDVGTYNVASLLASQIVIFIGSVITIFSPIIADLHNRGLPQKIAGLYKKVTRWILTVSLPLFLLFSLFPELIMYLFGPKYEKSSLVLVILAFAYIVGAVTGPGGNLLHMTGRQNVDFINSIILVFGNIALNMWLIPAYGAAGAALATAITLILIHTARLIEVYKIHNMVPYESCAIKPIIAAIGAAVMAMAFKAFATTKLSVPAYIQIPLVLVTYVTILLKLGVESQDRILYSAILKRTRLKNLRERRC